MTTQDTYDFSRIAEAIEYINSNYKDQPDLDEVAQNIHLSPFHFQRMFTSWAGVSPKKFLQFITVEHAKKILQESKSSIADAAYETGLSGTGRLHDLFINIEGMTPGEYKNGGKELRINYHYSDSPFGSVLIASTAKGICYMAFADDRQKAFDELKLLFPNASFIDKKDELQINALSIFGAEVIPQEQEEEKKNGILMWTEEKLGKLRRQKPIENKQLLLSKTYIISISPSTQPSMSLSLNST